MNKKLKLLAILSAIVISTIACSSENQEELKSDTSNTKKLADEKAIQDEASAKFYKVEKVKPTTEKWKY